MNDKILGIIGGMGPEATARFYLKLVQATQASKDQDHFRVIIDSNAKIPDRTLAILGRGPSPVAAIVESGKGLKALGVTLACMPCITAHYFYDEIRDNLDLDLVHPVKALIRHLKTHHSHVERIGVLSTTGTKKSGIFNNHLATYDLIYPSDTDQENLVMEAIYGSQGIKSGHVDRPLALLREAAMRLIDAGAQVIIAGCTEIPIVFKQEHIQVPLLDSMDLVIKEMINPTT